MAARDATKQQRGLDIAVAFVSRHMDEKIRLRDLSAAAGVSNRTMGYLFSRVYGTTPMAFVKNQRLAKAHDLLEHSKPSSTTVSDVARSCGFTHMGQFAVDYKHRFGESPSETLCRTRPPGAANSGCC